jgi:hypothetical protein
VYKAYLCSKIHNKICFVSFLLHFFFVHLPFKFIIKFVKFLNDKFIYLLYKYGHKMYKIMNTNHNSRHRFIARETDRKLEDPTCDCEHGFQGRLHSDYNFRSNVRQTCASNICTGIMNWREYSIFANTRGPFTNLSFQIFLGQILPLFLKGPDPFHLKRQSPSCNKYKKHMKRMS